MLVYQKEEFAQAVGLSISLKGKEHEKRLSHQNE